MKWTEPAYLLCLTALPFVLLTTLATERYLQQARRVWGGHAERLHWRSRLRLGVAMALLLALSVALGGLAVQVRSPYAIHDRVALAIGLDVSKSMLAEDVLMTSAPQAPANRLNLGRSFINTLLNELEGQPVGLFLFARNGIEVVPLTRDHGFHRYILRHTEMSPLTESGSDLLAAVSAGDNMLHGRHQNAMKAMLLISDGEDTENSPELEVKTLQFHETPPHIYTVRVGGDESVFIPIRKAGISGIEGFYTDEQGNTLQTRGSDELLRQLSAATQGESWEYNREEPRLAQQVAAQILRHSQQLSAETTTTLAWYDLSGLFLLVGLFFYAIYVLF